MRYTFFDEFIFEGDINKISNCKRKDLFLKIFRKYKQACIKLSLISKIYNIEQKEEEYSNLSLKNKQKYELIIECFNTILNKIKPEYKEIIVNDFVNEKSKDWYVNDYSRSTYYRLKMEAIKEFLYYAL